MDFTKLTNWTVRLLYLQIAISVIGLITGAMEHSVLRDIQNGNFVAETELIQAGEASDTRQGIVGGCQFLIYIVSGIWILRWIYVASSNARDLAAGAMKFSPGWAVGWYFIPFLNLWKPYQAMKEIWRVSANPRNPDAEPDSGLLASWWFFYIVSSLSGNAAFRLSLRADEIRELLAANFATRVSDIAGIPLAILFMVVVRRMHANQELARAATDAAEPGSIVSTTA
ncbi:DUF4328 domain-containing protein [Povalibacter sp.]|uniref:DUF4328 domain-containing protein n=1 Tax=Povalibacter sp. TaxID=1962978 RepID=UPI002F3E39A3